MFFKFKQFLDKLSYANFQLAYELKNEPIKKMIIAFLTGEGAHNFTFRTENAISYPIEFPRFNGIALFINKEDSKEAPTNQNYENNNTEYQKRQQF